MKPMDAKRKQEKEQAITDITNVLTKKKLIYNDNLSLDKQVELDELDFYLNVVKKSYLDFLLIKGNQDRLVEIELSEDAPQRLFDIRDGKKRAYLFLNSLDIDRGIKYPTTKNK